MICVCWEGAWDVDLRAPGSPGSILAPSPHLGTRLEPVPGSTQHTLPRCEAPLCSNTSLPGFLPFYLTVLGAFFPFLLMIFFIFFECFDISNGTLKAVPFSAGHPDTVAAVGRRGNKWEVQGMEWHRHQMLQQGNTWGPCDLSLLCGRGCCYTNSTPAMHLTDFKNDRGEVTLLFILFYLIFFFFQYPVVPN